MSSDPPNHDDAARQDDTERTAATAGTADGTTADTGRTAGEPNQQSGAGETVGRAFDSARGTLAQPGPKSQLTFAIGLFAVIGVGFGLTGIVVLALVAGSGVGGGVFAGFFLVSLLVVLLLTGSIVGAFCGLRVAEGLRRDARTVYLTSFVGTAVGYVVMVLIAVVLIGLVGGSGGQTGEGGNFFDVVGLLVPVVVLALPVGLTGVGASFLARHTTK